MESDFSKDEYEIQIYNFSVKQLKEDTESLIKNRTSDFIASLFRTLAKQDLIKEDDARLIEIRQKILDNICAKIKKNVNKIHKKFNKYLAIPDNVLLIENIPHEKYCNGNYDIATKQDKVDKMELELLQMKLFRKKLEAELEYHQEMDRFLVDEEAMIGIVKSILSEGNLIGECRNEELMINKLKEINESLLKN